MANDGIIVIGDQIQGYTERNIYVSWDINPDLISERSFTIKQPFIRLESFRYGTHEHIDHIYTTRWAILIRAYQPITERGISFNYKQLAYSFRKVYVYQDTRERWCHVDGLLTQTPLLLKYPKYYNWNFIPQVINPEFKVWSFYNLDLDNITVKIIGSNGTSIILNSGINKENFKIEKINKYIWKITVYVNHVFEPSENVSVYITLYDEKGNYLKPGLW